MRDKRLKILSKSEIKELYGIPQFNDEEKKAYFLLNDKEFQLMDSRGSLSSKVYFILQLGYFKATSQFFDFVLNDVKSDMQFILQYYFDGKKLSSNAISKKTRLSNQMLITQLLSFETDKSIIKAKLEKLLETKSRLSNNPVYLFHELLCHCSEHKLLLLGYTTIQELIGQAVQCEEKRLEELLLKHLSHQDWKPIDQLSKNENQDIFSVLKRDPKSFQQKHIKAEIKKIVDHEALYHIAKQVLPKLDITPQNIAYYASLAEHYPIRDLSRLSATKRAIYILCYAHHRHQKVNDNLTISFAHYVDKFGTEASDNAQKTIFNEKLEVNNDAQNAAIVFRFFDDEKISDKESFGSIRTRARKHVKKGGFNKVADYLMGLLFDFRQTKWDEIAKLKHKITANLRPIFKVLEFSGDDNQKHLLTAITFLKKYFSCQDKERKNLVKNVPIQFVPRPLRGFIMSDDKDIDIAKYEFILYQQIVEQIETSHIYLQNSLSFKSFSSYLISDEKWKNKLKILKELGNKKLLMPIDQLLNDFENSLESLILDVNARIKSGDNKGIKIKIEKKQKNKADDKSEKEEEDSITFTLPYPASMDKENHPIFKQFPQISIAEVIQFTQQHCRFMDAFTHIKPYDAKDKLDPMAIMACIIANATNLGIYKMAQSSDLDYQRMHTQMKNFMRLETLQEANDIIINAIANLPIFKYWNIRDDYLHGSVDGQKFETRLHSFIARYSSKYFGVNKGVVAYTLCANHIPVNTKIISASQHESHFLFDILYNVKSDLDIQWLSGDGHSINQVNFTLLDFIDKQFAPHFKRINHKAENLCGFKSLEKYKNCLIKPQHQAKMKIIKDDWDNIQRIIASLLLGETSQHLIISKLSSYKRKNKTKEALWEYDRILMSIYLLKFIDDPVMRKNVRRALNRGEAFHKFRRAIANVHGQKFRGKNDREIELWNECARLMANCVIFYNATLLNALLTKLQKEKGNEKLIEAMKYISPVAWIHVNMYGFYAFDKQELSIDIAKLVESINMSNAS